MLQKDKKLLIVMTFHDFIIATFIMQQQQPRPAGTSASTYVNRNVINSETPYINASLQLSEKSHYVNVKDAEVNFSIKMDNRNLLHKLHKQLMSCLFAMILKY